MSQGSDISIALQFLQQGLENLTLGVEALKQLDSQTQSTSAGLRAFNGVAKQNADSASTLSNKLGITSAQTGFLVREVASLAGVSGTAMTAINALTSGLSPLGLALTGVALGISIIRDKLDEQAKAADSAADALIRLTEAKMKYGSAGDLKGEAQETAKALEEQIKAKALELQGAEKWAEYIKSNPANSDMAVKNVVDAAHKLQEELRELIALRDKFAKSDPYIDELTKQMNEYADSAETGAMRTADFAAAMQAKAESERLVTENAARNQEIIDNFETQQRLKKYEDWKKFRNAYDAWVKQADDIMIQREKDIGEAMANARLATLGKLNSMAGNMLGLSEVTQQDLDDTAAGKYKDKPDENIRRLRLYPEIDSEMFKKLPAEIQAELKQAMAEGGSEGYKLKITDLIAKGEDYSDPRLWDIEGLAKGLKKAVEMEGNRLNIIQMIVTASGIDPEDPSIQKALGTAATTAIKGITDRANQELAQWKLSQPVETAINKDADNIKKAGGRLGRMLAADVADVFMEELESLPGKMLQALTWHFDGRYVRKPGAQGTTPD